MSSILQDNYIIIEMMANTSYLNVFGFQLSLPDDLIGSVVIVANALIFKASRKLSQFNVIATDFNTTMDGSRISVDIKLRRIISYHLTNTFLPTITLLIIAEVIHNLTNKQCSL